MYKRSILCAALAAATMGLNAQKPVKAPAGGKAISNELIGIFFEDINNSADGGLYAELIQNGAFEFSPVERDGWGPGTAWRITRPGHSTGYIQPRMDNPVHANNATYMRLHCERANQYYDYTGWTGFGIQNDGFDGISVKAGEKYDFSAFMRNVKGDAKQVRVVLIEPVKGWPPKDPKLLAETTFDVSNGDWKKFEAVLTPNADCKQAALQILVLTKGDMDIDVVSLMPEDTYKGHGLRKDLAQALADLHPKFMRFPGGCVVHGGGDGFWNTYRWKTTIGPKETRRQLKNTWGYHQSVGLGYFEYFQFCEDLGMEPLPILPAGVSCQGANGGWGMKGQAQDVVPMSEMDEWVDECIDLIEWANGDPATNKWAKMRAEAGHPNPFNLKYLGIGNEERISPEFCERFKYIYERVTKAHPEIVIVGTAGPGSHADNGDYQNGWKLAEELNMPILDEHYYEPNTYFLNKRQYDSYPRDRKTKVYLGEYAAKDKKLIDALAEGLYLLHVERNGDVVAMTSYAPLFARKNGTQWNPDLIYYDNERPFLTCSYYVQQLFGQSSGNYYYGDCVKFEGDAADAIQPMEGVHYGQSVILNTKTRQLFVKLVNASADAKKANINLSRFGIKKLATKTTLAGQPNDENNFDAQPIAPKKEQIKAQKKFTLDLAPYSMVMLQYQL
ncbi:Alpha-L-arabinofuranosidase [Prevotella sp. khp1]|uniref:alpha-L-arabinofuranosidase C-terminal domain-containing protein n=1 Tax=Prevotellaceae TaxID=171552 RepID=UPI0008863BB5|nr:MULTISPECIES: alpha-L-arabinofuranosidase C-terminal domain-containing protein [Prevotellaceae]QVJ79672.1 alpha-N-arabinofuranosidase [Xylanibacter ruminicola]SDQ36294.1 Alpha-L-arabinofuranosidase [Prevotella sp. khp1]